MSYTSDIARNLSRANLRAVAAVTAVMAFGVLSVMRNERGVAAGFESHSTVPHFDAMLIAGWSMNQSGLLLAVLACWMAFLGAIAFLDRSVRRGNGAALAMTGALGVAIHFANLPALAWGGIDSFFRLRTYYALDQVHGFLEWGFSPVALVTPLVRTRLDPLAWGVPATALEWTLWGLFASFWAVTLAASAAALWVGLRPYLRSPQPPATA